MKDKRILIIDDDEALCAELAELLKEEGCAAVWATDAFEGENLIRGDSFDVVLLDCKMPALAGVEILKKLKADNIRKRILMMTGRSFIEQELREADLWDMVSGVITKPVNFETLLEEINNTL